MSALSSTTRTVASPPPFPTTRHLLHRAPTGGAGSGSPERRGRSRPSPPPVHRRATSPCMPPGRLLSSRRVGVAVLDGDVEAALGDREDDLHRCSGRRHCDELALRKQPRDPPG